MSEVEGVKGRMILAAACATFAASAGERVTIADAELARQLEGAGAFAPDAPAPDAGDPVDGGDVPPKVAAGPEAAAREVGAGSGKREVAKSGAKAKGPGAR